jgi:multiple sugar transport system substrate-binding protein
MAGPPRRRLRPFRLLPVLATVAACLFGASCGGGSGDDPKPTASRLTMWSLESQPDRLKATRDNVALFTKKTGVEVSVVGIGDDELTDRMDAAKKAGDLPDVLQLPLELVHAYSADGTLDPTAAQEVVLQLGDDTFSQTALRLASRDGRLAAVPSDGWGQLLIYRKDLFQRAGLPAPRTLEDIDRAAARLDRGGMAGITLATTAGQPFTAETFEHIALAAGCRIVDDLGKVRLTSPECTRAFRYYVDLARRRSVGGVQDVDSTRDAYFAGRAAMILWSPFLLDALAGLRDDALPTCPECRRDRAFLARNSGLVGALSSKAHPEATQFGTITSWGITLGPDVEAAKRLVTYMMSDGYARWLALSPQGKYPVRFGDRLQPEVFSNAWKRLTSGVDRKAPLSRFYAARSIRALGESVLSFRRWGFEQDQAPLMGAVRASQPVTRALGAAIRGDLSPAAAAEQAQRDVVRLAAALSGTAPQP